MPNIAELLLPADVESQTGQIVRAGIAAVLHSRMLVAGDVSELVFWSMIYVESSCSTMLVCAQRRDGGLGSGVVRRCAIQVAHNHVGQPSSVDKNTVLSLENLRLLETLAVGREDFDLQPGLKLVRTAKPIPGYTGRKLSKGAQVTVREVLFHKVGFSVPADPNGLIFQEMPSLPRQQLKSEYFSLA